MVNMEMLIVRKPYVIEKTDVIFEISRLKSFRNTCFFGRISEIMHSSVAY